ncbi:DUF2147 domain-containing protein [Legionella londiniensis]|uniref:Putative signal peptide protein n=1 Tax=Legionella londiniensis TaxID=45068 RepID=A0A0W0VKX0_9GAMM|nr:DUF2147 domain-containing protein [Legionella londiniensis]KTD20734.1 putative signal peptide protein [Legionella londiniensis]STX92793.1 putative signal peptide protein [Legionella londiniensis]
MRRIVLSLVTFLAFFYMPQAMADMPVGTWTTMDDKTGKKRAVVELSLKNGELSGKIVKVFREKGDKGICAKCPGEFKNKPIEGLTFLWGLKDQGRGVWSSGQILDPKSGKIYRAKLSMHGDKLYVRGYVGLAMLGRTQVWVKKISASENHDPSMA